MGHHLPDVDPSRVEVDNRDEPVLVARNIKDRKFAHLVCTAVEGTYVGHVLSAGLLDHPVPGSQRAFRVWMRGPELAEAPEGNHVHTPSHGIVKR